MAHSNRNDGYWNEIPYDPDHHYFMAGGRDSPPRGGPSIAQKWFWSTSEEDHDAWTEGQNDIDTLRWILKSGIKEVGIQIWSDAFVGVAELLQAAPVLQVMGKKPWALWINVAESAKDLEFRQDHKGRVLVRSLDTPKYRMV